MLTSKSRVRQMVGVGVVLAPLLVTGCQDATAPANTAVQPSGSSSARIEFSSPVSLAEALGMAEARDLEISEVSHTFSLAGSSTGIYAVEPGSSGREIREKMLAAHSAFLRDLERTTGESRSVADGPALTVAPAEIHAAEAAIQRTDLQVSSMVVDGPRETLQSLNSATVRVSLEEIPPALQVQPLTATAVDTRKWVPLYGSVSSGQSTTTERYLYSNFVFDNTSGFGTNGSYEHEFRLNAYSSSTYRGKTYFDASEHSNQTPRVTYAVSNLPMPYLDTRAMDNRQELAFTIGTSHATLKTWFGYYTYMQLKNGNAAGGSGKLSAQRGHRSPSSWCWANNWTWCVFADQTVRLVPAWNIPLPGYKYWYRP